MNKNKLMWVCMILFLLPIVSASETCYVNNPCTFTTVVYNTSANYYTGVVTNSLINKSGSLLYENEPMMNITNGRYIYNYTFTKEGTYLRESKANSVIMNEQIEVQENYSQSTWEEIKMIIPDLIFWIQLIGLIGICLYKIANVMMGMKRNDMTKIWIGNIIANLCFIVGLLYLLNNFNVFTNSMFMLEVPFFILLWLFTIIEQIYLTKALAIDKDYAK